jgi:hypothetical protein
MDNYYEIHVTIYPKQILEFADFCKQLKAKPLYIKLDSGLHRYQPMLAATTMLPDDVSAKAWAIDYGEIVAAHFPVTRVKLESRLTEGPNEYYEAHWKFELSYCDQRLDAFLSLEPRFLRSLNLFNTRTHYLSQRIYGSSDPVAGSETFNAGGEAIRFGNLPLVKTHYERCVWDSNPALDYGWGT